MTRRPKLTIAAVKNGFLITRYGDTFPIETYVAETATTARALLEWHMKAADAGPDPVPEGELKG